MLTAMIGDAIFIAALFLEAVALLSLLRAFEAVAIPDALEPVLAFYRSSALPIVTPGTKIVWGASTGWAADATLIATVLFFLFFLRQARRAAAPYGGEWPGPVEKTRGRIDGAIDWALPGAFCAVGAVIAAPTLAPFLTLPAAIFLKLRRCAGSPPWFWVSGSYDINLLCLGLLTGGMLVLLR